MWRAPVPYLQVAVFVILNAFAGGPVHADSDGKPLSLYELSLEDLLRLKVLAVSKQEESLARSPATVDVVTHDMIRTYGYRTLYDVLVHTPGFWPIQDVNDRLLGMRGVHASTTQKFLVLINGKRLTENLWNLTDVDYNISLTHVKRIEILRGPGSAVYGRAALTAVINVITFSGRELDGVHSEISIGNHGYRKLGFSYGTATKGGELAVSGHSFTADGEEVAVPASEDGADHRIDGSEIIDRFKHPTIGLDLRFSHHDWNVGVLLQSRYYQQPRAANAGLNWQEIRSNDYFAPSYEESKLGEEHTYLVVDIDRRFSAGPTRNTATFSYSYSGLRLREITRPLRDVEIPDSYDEAAVREYGLGEQFEFDARAFRLGLEYFGQTELARGSSLLWGAEVYRTEPTYGGFSSNYTATVDGSRIIREPIPGGYFRELPSGIFDRLRTEWLYSVYGELKYTPAPHYAFHLGARYDLHRKGEDFRQEGSRDRYPDPAADELRSRIDKTESQLSPRLAFILQPFADERLTMKAIYNKSFIAPGYFYRYADPSTSYAGGPWLQAETLDSYLVSAETARERFRLRGLYFLNVNRNLLTRDASLTPARYTSLGKLAMRGAELDLSLELDSFSLFANYSYLLGVRSRSDDASAAGWIMDDGSIKNVPRHHGSVGLLARFLDRHLSTSLLFRMNDVILSPVVSGLGAGEVRELDSEIVTDLTIRYRSTSFHDLDLSLSVYNLFDEEILLGGTVTRPYHQPGRWYNISIAWKL